MKPFVNISSCLGLVLSLCAACSTNNPEPETVIDPVIDKASISVIKVSKQASIPSQLTIDGLLANNSSIPIGSSSNQPAVYEDIEAGVRKFSIGNYQDSITINKHNYYTIMVYDQDSIQLSLDAPYDAENKFVYMPLIRWNMIGDDPANYKVDFMGDSLIHNIPTVEFTPFSTTVGKVGLHLYAKNNVHTLLKQQDFAVEANKKYTINVTFDGAKNEYQFDQIIQVVK